MNALQHEEPGGGRNVTNFTSMARSLLCITRRDPARARFLSALSCAIPSIPVAPVLAASDREATGELKSALHTPPDPLGQALKTKRHVHAPQKTSIFTDYDEK